MAPLPKVADEIDTLTDLFARTGNRAVAWRVFSLCRASGRAIPDSVMAEVDRFAAGISDVAEKAMSAEIGDNPIIFGPTALGQLWRGNGGLDPVSALQNEYRDGALFAMILHYVDHGWPVGQAIDKVADTPGVRVKEKRLWQIWGAMNKPRAATDHPPQRQTVR